ncbi:MAG: EVE domain-containing protein [Planctomycetes bacterium]|nr:EVE domain-containing protein [Planctomycetota bacterium]
MRKQEKQKIEAHDRRYWLWVTRPEYYLDEQGHDREDLDPESGVDSDGWWTCHRDTQKGDFVLLYRSRLRRDIGYLIQAESDAYSIADDQYALEQGWDYACDYRILYKFENPVTLEDMRDNPYLHDWGAYSANFRRRVYEIPLAYWHRLGQALSEKNPAYKRFLANAQESIVVKSIMLEEELEEALVHDLDRLKPFGYNLDLWASPIDGASGRQLICKGNGGRIDLLCYDRRKKQYVVIELKNVRASQNTFAQVSNYVGWVSERIADGEPVIGLVISRGYDVRFQSAVKTNPKILHLDLEQIGFK